MLIELELSWSMRKGDFGKKKFTQDSLQDNDGQIASILYIGPLLA